MDIEIKTIGELHDQLITTSLKIWHLVDKAVAGTATSAEAKVIQDLNQTRSELIAAINRRSGERVLDRKVYG